VAVIALLPTDRPVAPRWAEVQEANTMFGRRLMSPRNIVSCGAPLISWQNLRAQKTLEIAIPPRYLAFRDRN